MPLNRALVSGGRIQRTLSGLRTRARVCFVPSRGCSGRRGEGALQCSNLHESTFRYSRCSGKPIRARHRERSAAAGLGGIEQCRLRRYRCYADTVMRCAHLFRHPCRCGASLPGCCRAWVLGRTRRGQFCHSAYRLDADPSPVGRSRKPHRSTRTQVPSDVAPKTGIFAKLGNVQHRLIMGVRAGVGAMSFRSATRQRQCSNGHDRIRGQLILSFVVGAFLKDWTEIIPSGTHFALSG